MQAKRSTHLTASCTFGCDYLRSEMNEFMIFNGEYGHGHELNNIQHLRPLELSVISLEEVCDFLFCCSNRLDIF